jgi:ribosome biogenesis GTPase
VFFDGGIYECFARKKLKLDDARLYVGDFVDFNVDGAGGGNGNRGGYGSNAKGNGAVIGAGGGKGNGKGVENGAGNRNGNGIGNSGSANNGKGIAAGVGIIESVYDRKNFFIRPYVSNIDQALIIVAPTPAPDLLLVDKMLVKCKIENVNSVILINKSDIDEDEKFSKQILYDYENVADKIIVVSAAKNKNIDKLNEILKGKLSCCIGQSAVGKTSILNALNTDRILKTDRLSRRIARGRHTTRHSEIYTLKNGGFIIDTPGFNLYHLDDVDFHSLAAHCKDLFALSSGCKYKMCTHVNEPDCAVKTAAANGKLSKNRYDRYVRLFNELYKEEKNKY